MASSNFWTKASPQLLSLMRIIAAFLFMFHGTSKLFGVPGGEFAVISFAKLFTIIPGLAGVLEFGGGLLLLIGLFTRPVAFVLSGMMAFAYFMAHFPMHNLFPYLNGGDLAVLFCFVFLYISAAGAGPWSVDHKRGKA